ncbi:hypothetical protein CYMTET_47832 [Cymbomonas tetramitiformis]|uniref:Uncharacterized protein n=1 Tax=Cymbomonas tetramitiformis TaxID=36881 RepID=A0AAE0BTE9_9CHLO|nr:hypothetical protein CYMTET_47832 [Cymbomonas tetramitiformis]
MSSLDVQMPHAKSGNWFRSGETTGASGDTRSQMRRIVSTSSLRSKPTSSSVEAPTAFDFSNNPDILQTTPVEEGREDEYVDKLAYAFKYDSDLLAYLKSNGLKMPEAAKLRDLEHDHEFYHVTANELKFCILPHPLRGNPLSVYHECARSHPADGRYAHQRLRYDEVEGVPDAEGMRYWTQLRTNVRL